MKILMPVLHYEPVVGGLETWTKNIAERLSDRAEIFVVTGKVREQPKQEIKNKVRVFRTSLFSLKDLSYSSPFYILTALPFIFFKSLFLFKKHRFNLCHCQGFLSSFLGYLLFKLCKVPYVVTVQRQENKNFLKTLVYKNAVSCIAASSTIKRYFEEIGVKNIEIIPNGIDLERFDNLDKEKSREKLGLKKSEFVIMTIARLEKVKGIQYLIKAMKDNQLSPQSRSAPAGQAVISYQLLIIGEGSQRQELEDLVKRLNLEKKVRFLGEVPNKKIPQYLAAADCFVLPSLKEGFGIVLLEAMAANVPVVAANVGGIPDIIEDGKTGILVEPKNPDGLAEAIMKIYSQPEFTQNLTKNARNNLEKYNWQNIAEKVYENYISHSNFSA
jgi:glycosyltransferase involved in cell wall biosynthesis